MLGVRALSPSGPYQNHDFLQKERLYNRYHKRNEKNAFQNLIFVVEYEMAKFLKKYS